MQSLTENSGDEKNITNTPYWCPYTVPVLGGVSDQFSRIYLQFSAENIFKKMCPAKSRFSSKNFFRCRSTMNSTEVHAAELGWLHDGDSWGGPKLSPGANNVRDSSGSRASHRVGMPSRAPRNGCLVPSILVELCDIFSPTRPTVVVQVWGNWPRGWTGSRGSRKPALCSRHIFERDLGSICFLGATGSPEQFRCHNSLWSRDVIAATGQAARGWPWATLWERRPLHLSYLRSRYVGRTVRMVIFCPVFLCFFEKFLLNAWGFFLIELNHVASACHVLPE